VSSGVGRDHEFPRWLLVRLSVPPPTPGTESSPALPRVNEHYDWALQLAELITSYRSIEHRIGTVVVRGFVLDMWKVFENFLITTTVAAIARQGTCPTVKDANTKRESPRVCIPVPTAAKRRDCISLAQAVLHGLKVVRNNANPLRK